MATKATSGPSGEFASGPMTVEDAIYYGCAANSSKSLFFQEDLVEMNLTKDLDHLTKAVQNLVNSHLFRVFNQEGHICWKLRSREIAAKLSTLTSDEGLVYSHIETAGDGGIWTKILRNKADLPQSTLTKCLKILESRSLVKPITSVKTPARKLYILAYLDPANEVTGGAWHSDGELDMGMISEVSRVVLMYVRSRSWGSQIPQPTYIHPPNGKNLPDSSASSYSSTFYDPAARKAHAATIASVGGATPSNKKFRPPTAPTLFSNTISASIIIPRGTSYTSYPTASAIENFIASNNILKGITLTHADLVALLDMLVYDGALERVGLDGFRTARTLTPRDLEDWTADQRREGSASAGGGTGLSQAPCGRCPVFALCEEGGPISASNCVYFEEWLRPWAKKGRVAGGAAGEK